MPTKTISHSTKARQGASYVRDRGAIIKTFDRNPRQWKQIVTTIENGKKVNGKPSFASFTHHVPV